MGTTAKRPIMAELLDSLSALAAEMPTLVGEVSPTGVFVVSAVDGCLRAVSGVVRSVR